MTSPEPFTIRHPYFSAVGFLLIVLGVVLGFGALNEFFLMSTVEQVALGDLVLAIIGIFLVIRLRWWAKSGFTKGIKWADVPLFILPAAVSLLSLSGGIRVSSVVTILTFAAVTLVVGFAEETYFRGLILTSLIPTGVFRAVIISSFSLLHLTCSIQSGGYGILRLPSLTVSPHSALDLPLPPFARGQGQSGPLLASMLSLILHHLSPLGDLRCRHNHPRF